MTSTLPASPPRPPVDRRGVYLDEASAVVLTEGVTSLLDRLWRSEQQIYQSLPAECRPGHLFEVMLRVKAITNQLRYHLGGRLPLVGCCPHCRGYDGNYVIDGQWWAYCQLCQVRWFIDLWGPSGSLWPVVSGWLAEELHAACQPVEGDFSERGAA